MSTITAPAPTRLATPARRLHGHDPHLGQRHRGGLRSGGVTWGELRWDRLATVTVGAAVVVWLLAGSMAGASDADIPVPEPISVVIQPGDTVWDLARTHAPSGIATLEYVMLVEQHNGVRAGALLPGTVLELPQA